MHPNIIAFDAFILTPSYSLVVMECHPRLIQIDLGEADAKPYFRAIVSAVSHLHAHGISHNDIKVLAALLRLTAARGADRVYTPPTGGQHPLVCQESAHSGRLWLRPVLRYVVILACLPPY